MKRRPLTKIAGLNKDQQAKLAEWLFDDSLTYRNIIERVQSEFQVAIDRTTLHRHRSRLQDDGFPSILRDQVQSAAEIARYSASGEAQFSKATRVLIEQHAFEMAQANSIADIRDDRSHIYFERLHAALRMLNTHQRIQIQQRNTETRELLATVKKDELALKREIHSLKCSSRREETLTSEAAMNNANASTPQANAISAQSFTCSSRGHETLTSEAPATTPDTSSHQPNPAPQQPDSASSDRENSPIFLRFPSVSSNQSAHEHSLDSTSSTPPDHHSQPLAPAAQNPDSFTPQALSL